MRILLNTVPDATIRDEAENQKFGTVKYAVVSTLHILFTSKGIQ